MAVPIGAVPILPALCRFSTADTAPHLGWLRGDRITDLTSTGDTRFATLGTLFGALGMQAGASLSEMVGAALAGARTQLLSDVTLLPPIDEQEVWAAGVTYERSREARMRESESAADMYWRVYDAVRPELFFKADVRRTGGPGGRIRVRADSRWTVPEPELTLVLSAALEIVGYTIGNDVSARDIEGENPLYLPQAKVFSGCCALGPGIVPAEEIADPLNLRIACSIERDGQRIWQDETNTGRLHRTFEDLVTHLGKEDAFPAGVLLMTGTCLVPPDTLTLQAADVVTISIDGLGTLVNTVG